MKSWTPINPKIINIKRAKQKTSASILNDLNRALTIAFKPKMEKKMIALNPERLLFVVIII